MKRIIPIVLFLGFVNFVLWIKGEPSVGLSLNRMLIGISSIFILIMLIWVEKMKKTKKRKREVVKWGQSTFYD